MTTTPALHEAPEAVEVHGEKSDKSKLAIFVGILKRFIGVKDISAVRLSLPAQLCEPMGNLEYWGYLDRPDYFASIGESDEDLDRMLEVIRFWWTKDLKYVKGKLVKPFNSILGEFYRCKWDVQPLRTGGQMLSATASKSSSRSTPSEDSLAPSAILSSGDSASTHSSTLQAANSESTPSLVVKSTSDPSGNPSRVVFLCEQVLHHPPVSAFYGECREKGLSISGNDQISAHFTGTSIKVYPGKLNKGVFITLKHRDDEEYQLTHPCAHVTGFISLKFHPYVTVSDNSVITCPKTKLKAILKYADESWFSRPKYAIEGVVFRYDPDNDTIDKLKSVLENDILLNIVGSWQGQIYYRKPGSSHRHLLVDLQALDVLPKEAPSAEDQLPTESRQVWKEVIDLMEEKEYSRATKAKQGIEAKQRKDAATRKERNEEWIPKYFVTGDLGGRAALTDEGREMLETIYGCAELKGTVEREEV